MDRHHWLLAALMGGIHSIFHVFMRLIPAFIPVLTGALGYPLWRLGMLVSVYFVGSSVGLLPMGELSDRYDRRITPQAPSRSWDSATSCFCGASRWQSPARDGNRRPHLRWTVRGNGDQYAHLRFWDQCPCSRWRSPTHCKRDGRRPRKTPWCLGEVRRSATLLVRRPLAYSSSCSVGRRSCSVSAYWPRLRCWTLRDPRRLGLRDATCGRSD